MNLSHFGTSLKIPLHGNQVLAFVFTKISFHFIIVVELVSSQMLIH